MHFSKITVLLFAGLAGMASARPRAEPNPFVPVYGRQGPPPPSGTAPPPPPPTGAVLDRRQPPLPSGTGFPPPPPNGTAIKLGRHRA